MLRPSSMHLLDNHDELNTNERRANSPDLIDIFAKSVNDALKFDEIFLPLSKVFSGKRMSAFSKRWLSRATLNVATNDFNEPSDHPVQDLISDQVVRPCVYALLGRLFIPVMVLESMGALERKIGLDKFYEEKLPAYIQERIEQEFETGFVEEPAWEDLLAMYYATVWIPIHTEEALNFISDEGAKQLINLYQYASEMTSSFLKKTGNELANSAIALTDKMLTTIKENASNYEEAIKVHYADIVALKNDIQQFLFAEAKKYGITDGLDSLPTPSDSQDQIMPNPQENPEKMLVAQIAEVKQNIQVMDQSIKIISEEKTHAKENIVDAKDYIKMIDKAAKFLLQLTGIDKNKEDFNERKNAIIHTAKQHLEKTGLDINLKKLKTLTNTRSMQYWEIKDYLHREINEAGSTYSVLMSLIKRKNTAQRVLGELMALQEQRAFYEGNNEKIDDHFKDAQARQAHLIDKLNHIRYNKFLPMVAESFRLISSVSGSMPFAEAQMVSASAALAATLTSGINDLINQKKKKKYKNFEKIIRDNSLQQDFLSAQYHHNANMLDMIERSDKEIKSSSGKVLDGAAYRKILADRLSAIPKEIEKLIKAEENLTAEKDKNNTRIAEINEWLGKRHKKKDEIKREKLLQELAELQGKNTEIDRLSFSIDTTKGTLEKETEATEYEKDVQEYIKPLRNFYDHEQEEFLLYVTGTTDKTLQDKIVRLRNVAADCQHLYHLQHKAQDQAITNLTQGPASILRILANYTRFSEYKKLTAAMEVGAGALSAASLGYNMYRICQQLNWTVNELMGRSEKRTSELFTMTELFNTFANPVLSFIQIGDKIVHFFARTFFGVELNRDLTLEMLEGLSKQLQELHKDIINTIKISHRAIDYKMAQGFERVDLQLEHTHHKVDKIQEHLASDRVDAEVDRNIKSRDDVYKVIQKLGVIACNPRYSLKNINVIEFYLNEARNNFYTKGDHPLKTTADYLVSINLIKDRIYPKKVAELCNLNILIAVNAALIKGRQQDNPENLAQLNRLIRLANSDSVRALEFLDFLSGSNEWLKELVAELQDILISIHHEVQNHDLESAITENEALTYTSFEETIKEQMGNRCKRMLQNNDPDSAFTQYLKERYQSNLPAHARAEQLIVHRQTRQLDSRLKNIEAALLKQSSKHENIAYDHYHAQVWEAFLQEFLRESPLSSLIFDLPNQRRERREGVIANLISSTKFLQANNVGRAQAKSAPPFGLKSSIRHKLGSGEASFSFLEAISTRDSDDRGEFLSKPYAQTRSPYFNYLKALQARAAKIAENPENIKVSWSAGDEQGKIVRKSVTGHCLFSVADKTVPLIFAPKLLAEFKQHPKLEKLYKAERLKLVNIIIEYSFELDHENQQYLLNLEYGYVEKGRDINSKISYKKIVIGRWDYVTVHALSHTHSGQKNDETLLNYFLVEAAYGGKLAGRKSYDLTRGSYFTADGFDLVIPDFISFTGFFNIFNATPGKMHYFDSAYHFDADPFKGFINEFRRNNPHAYFHANASADQISGLRHSFQKYFNEREFKFISQPGQYKLEVLLKSHESVLTTRLLKAGQGNQLELIKAKLNQYHETQTALLAGLKLCCDLDYFSLNKLLAEYLGIPHSALLEKLLEGSLETFSLSIFKFSQVKWQHIDELHQMINRSGNRLRTKIAEQHSALKSASNMQALLDDAASDYLAVDVVSKKKLLQEVKAITHFLTNAIFDEGYALNEEEVNYSGEYIHHFRHELGHHRDTHSTFYANTLEKMYSLTEFCQVYEYIKLKYSSLAQTTQLNQPSYLDDASLACIDDNIIKNDAQVKLYPLTNGVRWYLLIVVNSAKKPRDFMLLSSASEHRLLAAIKNKLTKSYQPNSRFGIVTNQTFYKGNPLPGEYPAAFNAIIMLECIEKMLTRRVNALGSQYTDMITQFTFDSIQQILAKHKYYLLFNQSAQPRYVNYLRSEFFAHLADENKCSELMISMPLTQFDQVLLDIQKSRAVHDAYFSPIKTEELTRVYPAVNQVGHCLAADRPNLQISDHNSRLFTRSLASEKGKNVLADNYAAIKQTFITIQMPIAACDKDGNCQFSAIEKQLALLHRERSRGVPYTHQYLRELAVNHVAANRDEFDGFFGEREENKPACEEDKNKEASFGIFKNIDEFIKSMKVDGRYGDNVTLNAISQALQKDIMIIAPKNMGSNDINEITHSDFIRCNHDAEVDLDKTIILLYDGVGHYETLAKKPNNDCKAFLNNLIEHQHKHAFTPK